MQPWHLTTSSTTRHALFPSEAHRTRAIHTIARVAGSTLVLFCIVDDHAHVVVLCDRAQAGRLARALKLSLGPIAAVPLNPVHIKPINGRNHMQEVYRYILQQPTHHGLSGHPALWSGSCFPDLIGARWVPGMRLRIGDVLPRIGPGDACVGVGLSRRRIEQMPLDAIRAVGAKRLVSAAAMAGAADPALKGKRAETSRARRVACILARQAGIPLSEMSWALDIHAGSARKLAGSTVEPQALAATRTALALEESVHAATPLALPQATRNAHRLYRSR